MDVEVVTTEKNVPSPRKVRVTSGAVISIIFNEGLTTPEGMVFVELIELMVVVVIIAFSDFDFPITSLRS